MRRATLAIALIGWLAGAVPDSVRAQPDTSVETIAGDSARGARWLIEKPADWNGTLLLFSHGWRPMLGEPEHAPPGMRDMLVADGYALAGSTYSAAGWAVAEAVPDQLDMLDEFAARFGAPGRVIAWGNSMGGLVTSKLAERHAGRIDGGIAMCASSGGALGMLNMGLDGAFAFVTLVAPDAGIDVVGIEDDRVNGTRVRAALERALASAAGRARVALAAVLGGVPGWTDPASPRPAPSDYAAQAAQMAATFATGVFLPRAEQEARAGGMYSWNTGVDYAAQLDASGRRALVEHMYALAGLDVAADLARLSAAPRIEAQPHAAAYMMRNFTPSGRLAVPVLSLHPIGDGITSPTLPRGYVEAIEAAGAGRLGAAAWNERAGHCTSTPFEMRAALTALERRIETGRWNVSAAELNRLATRAGADSPTFVEHRPAPMLRPCANRRDACPGYPDEDALPID